MLLGPLCALNLGRGSPDSSEGGRLANVTSVPQNFVYVALGVCSWILLFWWVSIWVRSFPLLGVSWPVVGSFSGGLVWGRISGCVSCVSSGVSPCPIMASSLSLLWSWLSFSLVCYPGRSLSVNLARLCCRTRMDIVASPRCRVCNA